MGSREVPPPIPGIEATLLPEGRYRASAYLRPCNWVQPLEGYIDTIHAPCSIPPRGASEPEDYPEGDVAIVGPSFGDRSARAQASAQR